jgi:hypothetical protein
MRSIRGSFVLAPPAGARVRTRLRLTDADEIALRSVGEHLGRLAGSDLGWRCRLGRSEDRRTARKRALTSHSSSRWAGSITRTSNDQWVRAYANLWDRRRSLRHARRTIQSRLKVPVGQRQGRIRGYATRTERFAKQGRLQHLEAKLAEVENMLAVGRVSVCRGGRRLARHRHALEEAGLSEAEWRTRWRTERLFLTADGEAAKLWGNETIRVHPDQRWCEIKLPAPLAHLANRPHGRYRLACPVAFSHRGDEWMVQAATGAVRYDISYDPDKARWYLDASWRRSVTVPPSLEDLRQSRALGIDLNANHLDAWVIDPNGNPVGSPHTIPLELDSLPASVRDGHLRAAITSVLRLATAHNCRSLIVEDLDFADARQTGREMLGYGLRGKQFRRIVAGIPTRRFRVMLAGMAANHRLWVIAADPGWTSRWGQRYWQTPLNESTKPTITVTVHHAAAVVIGRRGLGLRARRRQGVPSHDRRIVAGELPARPDPRPGRQGPDLPGGQRAAALPQKTRPAERSGIGDQVFQDRSGSPGDGAQPRLSQGAVE